MTVDVRGAGRQSLRLIVRDMQGRAMSDQLVESVSTVERQTIDLGRTPGLYLLQVSIPA